MKKEVKKETKKDIKEIDATGKVLGRFASDVAKILMGKDKASFVKHHYSGSAVKILNISKLKIDPKKLETISHKRYSGHPGGLKIIKASKTVEKHGYAELFKLVVYQMLPDNKIRREMMKNLIIEG